MTVPIRASLLFSALAMAALTAAFANPPADDNDDVKTSAHPRHWAYGGEDGPEHWGEISPDNRGVYAVDTVMPGHYADRPAQHIHYLISAPGHKTLITQAYFATDPYFDGNPDKNWKKRNIVSNKDLVLPVRLFEGKDKEPARAEITFDIVLEKA